MKLEDLKMYLVRNSSGQYYRRVGYNGYGECWTDDIARASVWTKLSTARGRVSYFANAYPEYPVPNLIEIAAGTITVHDETGRIKKAKLAKDRAFARRQEQNKKWELEQTQQELEVVRRKLIELENRAKDIKGDD